MTKFEKFEEELRELCEKHDVVLDAEYAAILVFDRDESEDVLNSYLSDETKMNFNDVEPRKE